MIRTSLLAITFALLAAQPALAGDQGAKAAAPAGDIVAVAQGAGSFDTLV